MPIDAPCPRAVFLSYAREDTDGARRIADALRAFCVEVWFDQSELRGGDSWDAKIRQQIRECALFIPIVSAHTEARREGYFRREWKFAADRTADTGKRGAFVVPVVIDDTRESGADVPDEFMRVQWTRLPQGVPSPQFVEQIKRLLDAARVGVSCGEASAKAGQASRSVAELGAEAHSTSSGPRAAPLTRRNVPRWAWGAVGAGLTALIVFIATRKDTLPEAKPAAASTPARATAPQEKSIAVLPFANLGADKADDYLGDGIAEELLNALCKIKGLRMPGRSSCFAFKGKTGEDIFREVGEKLRVGTADPRFQALVRKIGVYR